MAIHGDCSSYPAPELLQWIDSSRKTGTLLFSWEGGERKIYVLSGQIVATSIKGLHERIARILSISRFADGQALMRAFAESLRSGDGTQPFCDAGVDPAMVRYLAHEELFGAVADLTASTHGRFHWTEDADRSGEEWVMVDVSVRELVFEALRWVDEQPEVDAALPSETMVVKSAVRASSDLPLVHRIILTLVKDGLSIGRLRLAMGISRSAMNRRIYDLLRAGRVTVDGAKVAADPVADMLEKGAILVRERQYDAAGMVFSALLASDPADRRVQEFARMVEREHTAALYNDLPPIFVPAFVDDRSLLQSLRPEERQVASLVNGQWDVATIVLASHARELETLKALAKLQRMGLLRA